MRLILAPHVMGKRTAAAGALGEAVAGGQDDGGGDEDAGAEVAALLVGGVVDVHEARAGVVAGDDAAADLLLQLGFFGDATAGQERGTEGEDQGGLLHGHLLGFCKEDRWARRGA